MDKRFPVEPLHVMWHPMAIVISPSEALLDQLAAFARGGFQQVPSCAYSRKRPRTIKIPEGCAAGLDSRSLDMLP
jgi:hypothetical protein